MLDLKIGETLTTLEGTTVVESLERRSEPEPVYNIEVEGDHVYRVGESGVLVHNTSVPCCAKKPEDAPPPQLDGTDMKTIEQGCLIDLSSYVNAAGIQLLIHGDYKSPKDNYERTNQQRANAGIAPILKNGDGVQLHHRTQDFFSILDELSATFHQSVLNDTDFHPYADDPAYLSWRGWVGVYNGEIQTLGNVYNKIRGKYWKQREFD